MPDLCYSNICPADRAAFRRQAGDSIKNSRPSGRDFPNYTDIPLKSFIRQNGNF